MLINNVSCLQIDSSKLLGEINIFVLKYCEPYLIDRCLQEEFEKLELKCKEEPQRKKTRVIRNVCKLLIFFNRRNATKYFAKSIFKM